MGVQCWTEHKRSVSSAVLLPAIFSRFKLWYVTSYCIAGKSYSSCKPGSKGNQQVDCFFFFFFSFRACAEGAAAMSRRRASITGSAPFISAYFRKEKTKLNQALQGDILTKPSSSSADGYLYFIADIAESVRKWTWLRDKKVSENFRHLNIFTLISIALFASTTSFVV